MAQRRITRAEIDALARKLDQLGGLFTARERAVLHAVFDLASNATQTLAAEDACETRPDRGIDPTGQPAGPEPAADLPPLGEGFASAFQPGPAASFNLDDDATAAGKAEKTGIKVRLV